MTEGHCPGCGTTLDNATHKANAVPEAGDCSICLYCRTISVFTGNGLQLRRPTEEEMDRFLADAEVMKAVAVATLVDRQRLRRNRS